MLPKTGSQSVSPSPNPPPSPSAVILSTKCHIIFLLQDALCFSLPENTAWLFLSFSHICPLSVRNNYFRFFRPHSLWLRFVRSFRIHPVFRTPLTFRTYPTFRIQPNENPLFCPGKEGGSSFLLSMVSNTIFSKTHAATAEREREREREARTAGQTTERKRCRLRLVQGVFIRPEPARLDRSG